MPVFTIVHRVLPPLLWKRRSLKGKSPEITNEKNPDSIPPHLNETINETIMHHDVHHVHIAVNTKTPENTADSTSESRRYSQRPTQAQLARAVSWASIRSRDRWTDEQEKELVRAQRQLGRCQKAWSSEQEVWLSYVSSFFFLFLHVIFQFIRIPSQLIILGPGPQRGKRSPCRIPVYAP
jgi:hypothetical protein